MNQVRSMLSHLLECLNNIASLYLIELDPVIHLPSQDGTKAHVLGSCAFRDHRVTEFSHSLFFFSSVDRVNIVCTLGFFFSVDNYVGQLHILSTSRHQCLPVIGFVGMPRAQVGTRS